MDKTQSNARGIGFLVLAIFIFSFQNIAVKLIGGDYPLLEILIFRSIIALPCALLIFRLEGKKGLPKTQQPKLEYVRGFFLFLSYTTHYMGLASMPLAEVESIRFSGPLVITLLSIVLLGEKVKIQRWLALLIGFAGVLFIVRPGSSAFNPGSIFVLISVFFYSLSVIITRKLKTTESSSTMAFYSSLLYLIGAIVLLPLFQLIGEIPNAHPSVAFLFRTWSAPSLIDWLIMSVLGLVWASGIYFNARAYSITPASVASSFEYSNLPINIMWGFLIWHEIPTITTLVGAFLTLLSGLYVLYQERK